MKTTLTFPSYMHLAGFMSVAENASIEMDLSAKSLTAFFHEKDIQIALQAFSARIVFQAA